jgi:hypothetical protein
VDVDQLAQRFPSLWHVTFAGGWDGIQRIGFVRTIDVVLQSFGERTRVDPTRSLDGITQSGWWQLLNSRVYFFCRERDVHKLVESYVGRQFAQEVIKLRTKPVLADVADNVEMTTVNVGVFPRTKGPSRGRSSFIPLANYPAADTAKIQEITVAARVPVVLSAITSVVRHNVDWSRSRVFP